MLQSGDLIQIKAKDIDQNVLERQMDHFIQGFPFILLAKPATLHDGILCFTDERQKFLIEYYDQNSLNQQVIKFVPASGAASRMFKHLFEFREQYQNTGDEFYKYLNDNDFTSAQFLLTHLKDIAFYKKLQEIIKEDGGSFDQLMEDKNLGKIIDYILTEIGLNYSNLPKALIQFHNYPDGARTALEEHLVEAAHYARDSNHISHLHFTISPEHHERVKKLLERVLCSYESKYNVTFNITFSIQKPSTDTLAVDEFNKPFRNSDGSLLFRPGGHGALLQNLNELDGDIIFIKNIDNIVPDRLKGPTFYYKKLIGGYLLWIRDKIFEFLSKSSRHETTPEEISEMTSFVEEKLFQILPVEFHTSSFSEQVVYLENLLNRPIRVCGMVKNEGEPGGGPFWVIRSGNKLSLQIVESSQINLRDPWQKEIVVASTHFNPVDLVCSIKDFRGRAFDLSQFVDEETGFISIKSSEGRNLKALELPGLWNGAMADWITVFIEVPIITFNPVKTVNDLLRKEHAMIE